MIPSWSAKHLIILQRHNLPGQPDHRYVQGEPGSSLPHCWEGTIDHLVQLLNDRAVPQRPGLQTWLHGSFIVYKLQTHSWSREWWMGCYRLQHHITSSQEIKPVPNAHQKTKKSSGKSNMPIFPFLGILPKQNTALLSLCPFFSPSQAWYLSCSWCCLSHIVPGLLKRLNPVDYFIQTLQISITCFGWRPDHMVFDSQLTKIYKDHKKLDPTFTFSQRLWQKVKAGKKWVLNFNPSGVWLCPTFPLLLCPRTPPCWNYSSNFHWSKDTSFQLGLSTTQPLWLALRTGWFLVEIRPCCSFSYPDLDEQSWHLHQLSFSEHLRKIALPPFWSVRTLELKNSSMLFFDVFPKWFVAPLLVYIINILRTSLEYILPSFSSIFWLKLETAHHAFDLIAQSSFPTHPKLPSIASEAFFSFAVLFCTFARDSAAQLLSKWSSSPLRDRHRDVGSLQLLHASVYSTALIAGTSIGKELQLIIMPDVGSKECKITKKFLYFPLLFFTISSAIGAEKSDRAKFFSLAFSPIAVAQSILLFPKAVTPVLSMSEIKYFLVPL